MWWAVAGWESGWGSGWESAWGHWARGSSPALFPVTLIGTLYLAMRRVMKSTGRKRLTQLEGLVDRIARYARPRDALPAPGD